MNSDPRAQSFPESFCCESRSEDIDSGYLRTSSVVIPQRNILLLNVIGAVGYQRLFEKVLHIV